MKCRRTVCGIAVVGLLLSFAAVSAGERTAERVPLTKIAVTEDVLGSLEVPYNGPGYVEITEDGLLLLDVGGNVGMFGIPLSQSLDEIVPMRILGFLSLDYDVEIQMLYVSIESLDDEMFEQTYFITPRRGVWTSHAGSRADDDAQPCPINYDCCSCSGSNGGSASAQCRQGERAHCQCNPCCSGRCIIIKKLKAAEAV